MDDQGSRQYYLQYGAGIEFNATPTALSFGSPLGPFAMRPTIPSPIARRLCRGTGHGSTFEDNHGNWWNSGTSWIGLLGHGAADRDVSRQVPSGRPVQRVDPLGDFPHFAPSGKVEDLDSLFTGWMLLSYRKPMTASSHMGEFTAERASDEDPRTFWVAADKQRGQALTIDLGGQRNVRAVQVNFADFKSNRYADAPDIYTEFELQHSADGRRWLPLGGPSRPRRVVPTLISNCRKAVRALSALCAWPYRRCEPGDQRLRVFGNGDGRARRPSAVSRRASRPARRDRALGARPGSGRLNIRFGIRPTADADASAVGR